MSQFGPQRADPMALAAAAAQGGGSRGGDPVRQAGFDQSDLLLRLLQQLAQQGAGMVGNMTPTADDYKQVGDIYENVRQMMVRQAQTGAADIGRAVSAEAAQRGMSGSTFEAAQYGLGTQRLQDRLLDVLNQTRAEQSQALMQLPIQRAGANAQLFDSIVRAATPALEWRRQQLGVGGEFQKQDTASAIGNAIGAIGSAATMGATDLILNRGKK